MIGGVNSRQPHGAVFVQSVAQGGPAEREGTIKPGDHLLRVNGSSLVGLDHVDVVQRLKEAGDEVEIEVERTGGKQESVGGEYGEKKIIIIIINNRAYRFLVFRWRSHTRFVDEGRIRSRFQSERRRRRRSIGVRQEGVRRGRSESRRSSASGRRLSRGFSIMTRFFFSFSITFSS